MTLAEQQLRTGREAEGPRVCGRSEPEISGRRRVGERGPWHKRWSKKEGAKEMPSEGREWQGGGGESPCAGRALAEVCDSVQGVRSGG